MTPLFLLIILAAGCSGPADNSNAPDPQTKIDIEGMQDTVRFLTSIDPPRNHQNVESMEIAASFIKQKMESYGIKTETQKFEVEGEVYVNIIGIIGADKKTRVIVGAHYDVCGDQPGADDNASAVAGLLEIARFAKEHEPEMPYRIDFVAYALEEPPHFATGHMGSYVHAKSLRDADVDVKGMIALEMIGYFTDKENSQEYPLGLMKLFYPDKGNFIGVIGNLGSSDLVDHFEKHLKASSLEVSSLTTPFSIPVVDLSDHWSYREFGYASIMITDTAFYRNPNYHKKTDTFETLDFAKMAEVVKGLCWALLRMRE